MIVVNVQIESAADSIEALKGAISEMETATRDEDGCEDYTFSVELSNPASIRVTERWRDEAALKAHMGSPHMAAFQKAMGAHPPKGMDMHFYDAKEISPPRP